MLLLTMSLVLCPVATCAHGLEDEVFTREGMSSGHVGMSFSSLKVARPLS